MAQTPAGAAKAAAKRIGVGLDFYLAQKKAGLRWCSRCKTWKLPALFPQNSGKPGNVSGTCLECSRVKVKKSTKGRVSTFKGHRHTPEARRQMSIARTGSRNHKWKGGGPKPAARRARWVVHAAIAAGRLAPPTDLPCLNCGTQARYYHHHRGYAPSRQLDVQALCPTCHMRIHVALRKART